MTFSWEFRVHKQNIESQEDLVKKVHDLQG